MGPSIRRTARIIGSAILIIIGPIGSYLGYLQLTDNFATVVPNEVYRSAQLTSASIHEYAARNGIRTILNLRGDNTGSPWYDREVAAANDIGITHIDYRMSARQELDQKQVEQLIYIMRSAPKPLLIHCKSGADRTGLASALYLAVIAKRGENAAEGQISLYYGHLSLPFIPEYAMDRTFESMEPLFGFQKS
jgi:uncharacterized protein (TIGR01244 family)